MRRRSNRQLKTVRATGCDVSWCHLAIMQGHATDSKCSWSARITSKATYRGKTDVPGRIQNNFTTTHLAPMTSHRPHFSPKIFRPSVWPRSCSFSTSDSYDLTLRIKSTRSGILTLECSCHRLCFLDSFLYRRFGVVWISRIRPLVAHCVALQLWPTQPQTYIGREQLNTSNTYSLVQWNWSSSSMCGDFRFNFLSHKMADVILKVIVIH